MEINFKKERKTIGFGFKVPRSAHEERHLDVMKCTNTAGAKSFQKLREITDHRQRERHF